MIEIILLVSATFNLFLFVFYSTERKLLKDYKKLLKTSNEGWEDALTKCQQVLDIVNTLNKENKLLKEKLLLAQGETNGENISSTTKRRVTIRKRNQTAY